MFARNANGLKSITVVTSEYVSLVEKLRKKRGMKALENQLQLHFEVQEVICTLVVAFFWTKLDKMSEVFSTWWNFEHGKISEIKFRSSEEATSDRWCLVASWVLRLTEQVGKWAHLKHKMMHAYWSWISGKRQASYSGIENQGCDCKMKERKKCSTWSEWRPPRQVEGALTHN